MLATKIDAPVDFVEKRANESRKSAASTISKFLRLREKQLIVSMLKSIIKQTLLTFKRQIYIFLFLLFFINRLSQEQIDREIIVTIWQLG